MAWDWRSLSRIPLPLSDPQKQLDSAQPERSSSWGQLSYDAAVEWALAWLERRSWESGRRARAGIVRVRYFATVALLVQSEVRSAEIRHLTGKLRGSWPDSYFNSAVR
jgi:hypothetical protein